MKNDEWRMRDDEDVHNRKDEGEAAAFEPKGVLELVEYLL